MKKCPKCLIEKPLSEFAKCSRNKSGLTCRCKVCIRECNKSYRDNNPDLFKQSRKKYYDDNSEYIREQKRINNRKFADDKSKYDEVYRRDNKEKIAAYKKEWARKKRNDPMTKIKRNLRRRIHHLLRDGYKSKSTAELIGCSFEEFKNHIQAQFVEGMSWDNYGPDWHIDHIIPCYKFDLTILEEQYKCFNYKNQRPLWALDNLKRKRNEN